MDEEERIHGWGEEDSGTGKVDSWMGEEDLRMGRSGFMDGE
jgi:hypothetical protein